MLPAARLIWKRYVLPAARFDVAMLKIHCWPDASQRKAASGTSVTTPSVASVTVPLTELSMVNEPPVPAKTAALFEIGRPAASQTRNFTGIVLPPLRL